MRLVIEPRNIEVGAFRHRGDKTWQAFGNFGNDALNVPGFEDEEKALKCAERWLADRLDKITRILRESVDRRLAAQS